MLGKNRYVVVLLAVSVLSAALTVPEPAFGLGDQPPAVYVGSDPFTQRVNAGDTVVYDVWVSADWFNDWLNISIGSKFADPINVTMLSQGPTPLPQTPSVEPLPEGVEVSYPSKIFIGDTGRSFFPISVKVSPNICQSTTIDLAILASGTSKMQNEFYNQPFYGGTIIRLYEEPKNTPLGAASTVLYEGFDRVFVLFKERDTDTPGGWTISRSGTIDLTNDTGMNMFRTDALLMNKTSSAEPVWIEHSFPKINDSFILDFSLLTNTTRISLATNNNFTMYLIDSLQNTNITTAGLSNGSINVQSRDYGTYSTNNWYRFRLEANAINHTFRWYLDGKYMDTQPFTGQPDKIRIAITGNQPSTSYVDDIFLQKITEPSTTNTSITKCTSAERTTIKTTLVSTTTITQSTITTTTTATTTLTSTTTSTEQVTDPSTYAWAVSATVTAMILAVVLMLQRRRTR